ncbi:MAG: type II toxin-antitoxin system Phd/YefM family antitoxin [Holosporales bacterium]|jgi:antitoxin YefM
MDAVTYTQARAKFSALMDRVCLDHDPVLITRQKQAPVVMMSLEDYNAIEETLYLMRNPANAARLAKALADLEQQRYQPRTLLADE